MIFPDEFVRGGASVGANCSRKRPFHELSQWLGIDTGWIPVACRFTRELVEQTPEVLPGFLDRLLPKDAGAAVILKARTFINLYNLRGKLEGAWLDNLRGTLDRAVAAAYGWPAELADDEVLARLLGLNHARAGGSTRDRILPHLDGRW